MAYLELIISAFNTALQENKADLDAIQQALQLEETYSDISGIINHLFYNQDNIQKMVEEVNWRLTELPQVTKTQAEKYMKQEKAAELGEGLFYLLKLYATVAAMVLTYAHKIHTKYNIGAVVTPRIDIKESLANDEYPNITASMLREHPRKYVVLQIVFSEADISDFIRQEGFINNLKQLDVNIEVSAVYNYSKDKKPAIETIKLSELAKWLNKFCTAELLKGE